MENDPFAKIHLTALDIAKAAGGWALELFKLHLLSPVSDHFQDNRGGGPALDRALYDEPQVVYHSKMGDTTITANRYKQTQ